jgi:hypothetical protein
MNAMMPHTADWALNDTQEEVRTGVDRLLQYRPRMPRQESLCQRRGATGRTESQRARCLNRRPIATETLQQGK